MHAELAAEPALLEAAERRRDPHGAVRVDREHAGVERTGDAERSGSVARPDRAGEAVDRVVGDPHGVRLVLERDQRCDRTEDLLARDPVVGVCLDEGARIPEALAAGHLAAEQRLALDEAGHRLAVRRGDQRAHLGRIVLGIPDPDVAGRLDRAAPRSGRTRAARRGCASGRSSPGRRCRRPRTARPRRRARGRRRRRSTFADLPPSSRVTRLIVQAAPRITSCPTSVEPVKPIFATSGCSIRRWPTTEPLPTSDVEDALGDPRLERELGEQQRRQRRQLGRLQHDGVAAGESGSELPGGDVEREVPRGDQPDDAERLTEGEVDAAGDGDRLAEVLVDGAGVVVEDLGDHADLAPRAADRLADIARLDPRQLLGVLLDERGEPAQEPRAVRRERPRARPERPAWPARPRRRSPRRPPPAARRAAPRWRDSGPRRSRDDSTARDSRSSPWPPIRMV